jgi:hypothetical protein
MVSMYKNPLKNLEDWPEKSQAAIKESYGLQWIKIPTSGWKMYT